MKCVYEIRLTKYDYEKSPRTIEDFCLMTFFAEIPCALNKGDEVDGLPALPNAFVSHCIWSHKNGVLAIRLQDEEYPTHSEFMDAAKAFVRDGWIAIVEPKGGFHGN